MRPLVRDAKPRQAPEARAVRRVPVDVLLALRPRATGGAESCGERLRQARGDAVVAGIGLHVAAGVDVAAEARDVVVAVVDGRLAVRAGAREVRRGRAPEPLELELPLLLPLEPELPLLLPLEVLLPELLPLPPELPEPPLPELPPSGPSPLPPSWPGLPPFQPPEEPDEEKPAATRTARSAVEVRGMAPTLASRPSSRCRARGPT